MLLSMSNLKFLKFVVVAGAALSTMLVRGADNEARGLTSETRPAVGLAPAPAPGVGIGADRMAPPGGDREATARFLEAMRQRMQEVLAQTSAERSAAATAEALRKPASPNIALAQVGSRPDAGASVRQKKKAGAGVNSNKMPIFPPLEGPASALSLDKQQGLAELLDKYRRDEITPEDYHAQRSKILARP
jgi:hypothetical protein